tara:strand:+ start:1836 stop:2330 length:495 start_codon:yes stop_codon:yes gene_type:complete
MNNIDKLNAYIRYITIPQEKINDNPICPYAKRYLDKISHVFTNNMEEEIEKYYDNFPKDMKIVLILSEDITKYNVEKLDYLAEINQKRLNKKDIWIAYDHPNNNNYIGEVKTNNNHFAIILLQPLKELIELSNKLKRFDYYDHWSKSYYKEIVEDRKRLLDDCV